MSFPQKMVVGCINVFSFKFLKGKREREREDFNINDGD